MARGPNRHGAAPRPAGPPRLSYVLGRVDFALRRRLAAALAPLDLSLPQYSALSVLRRRDGLSNAQLARRALITPQSMIAVTAALERKGLIVRAANADHGRILDTLLTPRAHHLLELADPAVEKVEDEMLKGLSAAQRARLLEELVHCARRLGAGMSDI